MIIKIKYHTDGIKLEKLEQGDWIDLKAAETVELKQGEDKLISLGISMELPKGYEAHIVPRSSTFKKWGVLQVNSKGIIDESYKGQNDVWGMWVIAMRDTVINKGDRICQFRIMQKQPEITFVSVATLDNKDRGGFGSTG